MFKANGERKEFPLSKSKVVVGRKNNCDLRIPLSAVSRQHFSVEVKGDELNLRDLGSSNGTYYNDERVTEAKLAAGDVVRVGPVTFIVVVDGQPDDIEPIKTVLPAETGEIEAPAERAAAAVEMAASNLSDPVDLGPSSTGAGMEVVMEADDEDGQADDIVELIETPASMDDLPDDDPIAALEALAQAGDDPVELLDDDDDEDK